MFHSLFIVDKTEISVIDKENNVYLFNLDEEITLPKEDIKFRRNIYPTAVLFDKNMKIVDEVFEYLKSKASKGAEDNTIIAKGYDLKKFYNYLSSTNLKFTDIKARHINDFISFLLTHKKENKFFLYDTAKRAGTTINRIIATVRNFYQYLNIFYDLTSPFENEAILINRPRHTKEGLLAHTRKGKVSKSIFKVKEKTKDIKIINFDEYKKIISSLMNERDLIIFQLMFFTGARIGEILSLKIQDIKTFNAQSKIQKIALSPSINDENIRRRQKTGARKLFIPNWLYHKINNYYNGTWDKIWNKKEFEHNYLFIGEATNNIGNPISYSSVNKKFNSLSKKIDIKFSPHDLRHTFATNLARNKVDITTIQKLLGHKDPSTCSKYIELAKEDDISKELKKIYDKYEVL